MAIDNEDYSLAAEVRDKIHDLNELAKRENTNTDMYSVDSDSDSDSDKKSDNDTNENELKLGQWVTITALPEENSDTSDTSDSDSDSESQLGVIAGIDYECYEDIDWIVRNNLKSYLNTTTTTTNNNNNSDSDSDSDTNILQSKFYLVLVHDDRTEFMRPPMVAYVPEKCIQLVHDYSDSDSDSDNDSDEKKMKAERSAQLPKKLTHPYLPLLFLGQNSFGNTYNNDNNDNDNDSESDSENEESYDEFNKIEQYF